MKALILLGGLGSRLRPLTVDRPKPLLPILNRPFIAYQIDLLKKFGVREVVLGLGHKAAAFRRQLGTGKEWGVKFIYSLEKEPLGTGGAIRHALDHLNGPAFILNGDVLSDFDLKALAETHRKAKADATLALVAVDNPAAYGLVESDPAGLIRRFLEKPPATETVEVHEKARVNAGCYLFEPKVVERIPVGRAVSIEREIFPALLEEGFRLAGFFHRGYWSDIGTLKTYWRTHADLQEMGLWPPGLRSRGGMHLGRGAVVGAGVRVLGTAVVGAGVRLGARVTLEGRVTIGAGARIEDDARLSDCVVLEGAHIGARTQVERSLLGSKVVIGADCRIGPDQVLADRARLPSHSQALPGLTER